MFGGEKVEIRLEYSFKKSGHKGEDTPEAEAES